MDSIYNIPTEIAQLFSSKEARQYRLIPYNTNDKELFCFGEKERNYSQDEIEIEIIFGKKILIQLIDNEEFSKLLQIYYRSEASIIQISTLNTDPKFLTALIEEAFALFASDIHFEVYEEKCRVRFRIDGKLLEKYVIEKNNYLGIINQIKILANLDISEKRLPQDGRILYNSENEKFDVRVSTLPTIYGEKIVLRLLTRHHNLLILDNLGFDLKQLADYKNAINQSNGLVLISGPTGSGKSTTLYATLISLNNVNNNILTIEDPVEYTIPGINQVQLKEEIGLTFGNSLRTFLRQDPDIIMLGEIRDSDTANMAIRSSLTGHLVFSTIHTNSAWGIISRLIDMGIHPYLIAETLRVCVAQRLIRILCPYCKTKTNDHYFIESQMKIDCSNYDLFTATGCEHCYFTGYLGRKAIYEVLPIDYEVSKFIRSQSSDITEYLHKCEIKLLKDSAIHMLLNGMTSFEELSSILLS
jgi:general secretion pathway protein E/type IV pilus assembly protein PilB